MDGCVSGWMVKQMGGWINGWMDGCLSGWMVEQMDGWMVG